MENILTVNGLTKKYKRLTALDHLELTIESGMIFGLLGPNGSGKTTTLGMLLDVLKPTSGSFQWFGQEPSADSRKQIGAILETPCFYPYLTAAENLAVVAKIKECGPKRIDIVLRKVGLYDRRDDAFSTYSLGMKQRLAIGSALLADPKVLILDEPTNGLDPMGIVEIRNIIQSIAADGKTIILASHLLDEVQKVCTHFCVLSKGKKLYQGSVSEALSAQKTIEVAADNMDLLQSYLQELEGVKTIKTDSELIQIFPEEGLTTTTVNVYLQTKGMIVSHLVEKGGSLESEFLKILKEND